MGKTDFCLISEMREGWGRGCARKKLNGWRWRRKSREKVPENGKKRVNRNDKNVKYSESF